MKTIKTLLTCLIIGYTQLIGCTQLFAQTGQSNIDEPNYIVPPEYEAPSMQHSWRRNEGQLTDPNGVPVPEVQYYSAGMKPSVFLTNEMMSFVFTKVDTNIQTPDSTHRVDIQISGSFFGSEFIVDEELPGFDNYFLGHIPDGVTDIKSYERIVAPDIYPNIDFHLYSNNRGLKMYFVIEEGADPSGAAFEVFNADYIQLTSGGGIKIITGIGQIEFVRAQVFEIGSNNTRIPLPNSGKFYEQSPGVYGIEIEPYSGPGPIVIQIDQGPAILTTTATSRPEWGTFYGGAETQAAVDMDTDADGNMYVTGEFIGTSFPQAGPNTYSISGNYDVYLGKFDNNYQRQWMIAYGGTGSDKAAGLVSDGATGRVYICGETEITNLPLPQLPASATSYQENYPIGTKCGFFAGFNKQLAYRINVSYFGGRTSVCSSIGTDGSGNIFVAGATFEQSTQVSLSPTGGSFPVGGPAGAYIQTVNNPSSNGPDADGFVAKFDPLGELKWSTLWGGNGNENIVDLGIDGFYGYVYIVGATQSTNIGSACNTPATYMPFCNPGNGAYFEDQVNGNNIQSNTGGDGMIARFTLNGELSWSTFFGGPQQDAITGIAVVTSPQGITQVPDGTFFITGFTRSQTYGTNCANSFSGGFPRCNNGNAYSQPFGGGNNDAFIAEFNRFGVLNWSTFLGGSGIDNIKTSAFCPGPRVDVLGSKEVFLTSGTTSFDLPQVAQNSLLYTQGGHNDFGSIGNFSDGYVMGFDSQRRIIYSTYLGGHGNDYGQAIALFQKRIYAGGATRSTSAFPLNNPAFLPGTAYYVGYPLGGFSDSYFCQLSSASIVLSNSDIELIQGVNVYPNPNSGYLEIDLNSSDFFEGRWTICDLQGKVLMAGEAEFLNGKSVKELNIEHLPNGLYIISIKGAEYSGSTKFIKQ